jgi:hypothetical protein
MVIYRSTGSQPSAPHLIVSLVCGLIWSMSLRKRGSVDNVFCVSLGPLPYGMAWWGAGRGGLWMQDQRNSPATAGQINANAIEEEARTLVASAK